MTHDELNKAIRDLSKFLLGVPDNFMRKAQVTGAPAGRNSEPFASVLVMLYRPATQWAGVVQTEHESDENKVVDNIRQQYEAIVSVQFFRDNAMDKLTKLVTLMQSPQATAWMQEKNMGLTSVGSPKNLSVSVGTIWEDRAQVDLGFAVTVEADMEIDTYGTFPIDVDTENLSQHMEVLEP